MMKITVIGYWGAYPEKDEATSAYLLQHNGKNILIDCGSGVLSKLQNFVNLSELDSVVLSHYHADHMCDIYSLQYAAMIATHIGTRTKPLHIYGLGDDPKFESLSYGQICFSHPLHNDTTTNIEGLKFGFIKTEHPVACLGMRIEFDGKVIAYTADTEWTDNLRKIADKSDLLICECNLYNYQKGIVAGHLTAGEAGTLAAAAGVKHLVLSHLPHYGQHSQLVEEAKEAFKGMVSIAHTGLELEL
jgi:ribonuclease BN (tRNA processing enzyme)